MLVYSIILKSADIGHTAKPLELHQVWTYKVVEEFYCQGDLEREHSLPISMYCDRLTTDLAKSQYGFIKNIAFPMFRILSTYLNSPRFNETILTQIKDNKKFWKAGGGNRRYTLHTKKRGKQGKHGHHRTAIIEPFHAPQKAHNRQTL